MFGFADVVMVGMLNDVAAVLTVVTLFWVADALLMKFVVDYAEFAEVKRKYHN